MVRSKNDMRLDDADQDKGLEPDDTINIHWGGKGLRFDVKTWSEGCQVVNGSVYVNFKHELIDCSAFAATNNRELAEQPGEDARCLQRAPRPGDRARKRSVDNTVQYMLLMEPDLDLSAALAKDLADTRANVRQRRG